jgi:hypothetical protein
MRKLREAFMEYCRNECDQPVCENSASIPNPSAFEEGDELFGVLL